MFLSSERGKRVLNFLYSWGASIVILGALFKLLHIPYANQILFVAMITESIVFFISAFEHPNKEYHWEEPDGPSGFYRYADLNHDQFYG